MKCVNWDLPQEAKQALELLGKWKPMDVEDSLELLSSHYTNPTVRRYAVARLRQADDEVRWGVPYSTLTKYILNWSLLIACAGEEERGSACTREIFRWKEDMLLVFSGVKLKYSSKDSSVKWKFAS